MTQRNRQPTSAGALLMTTACMALAGPAFAQFAGGKSVETTTLTPTACTAWAVATVGGVPVQGGSVAWYFRTCTLTQARSVTTTITDYPSRWDRFWGNDGVVASVTVTTFAPVVVTDIELRSGSILVPPANVLPAPSTSAGVVSLTPPPTGAPAAAMALAGAQIDPIAPVGAGYNAAAGTFGSLLTELGTVDDPYGLLSTFQADFSALQSGMGAIGSLLLAGIPTNPAPFLTLAADLRDFSADLSLLPNGRDYVAAASSLVAVAATMEDSAGLIQLGLTGTDPGSIDRRVLFLQNLQTISDGYRQFGNAAATGVIPEPSSVALLGAGFLCLLARHRRRAA